MVEERICRIFDVDIDERAEVALDSLVCPDAFI